MKNTKTTFKMFSVFRYRQEEEYLSRMHENGWRFTKVVFPGFYHFESCSPEKVTYRLDYNLEGIKKENKKEYIRLFADCGWEYILDFCGYSYFRKKTEDVAENEEIFCDDESRLDMMKRVFMGIILVLFITFPTIIMSFLHNVFESDDSGSYPGKYDVTAILLMICAFVYLLIFALTAVWFYKAERAVKGRTRKLTAKYVGIFAIITVLALGVGGAYWYSKSSDYKAEFSENGFAISAQRLNSKVEREYDLNKNDVVSFNIKNAEGYVYFSVSKDNEEPVFYGNFKSEDPIEYEIQEDGHYILTIAGSRTSGDIEVSIFK